MTGTDGEGTWQFRTHSGLWVQASRRDSDGSSVQVDVQLEIDPDVDGIGIRLRTRQVTITYGKTSPRPLLDLPAIEQLIERWANEPANALRLLDTRERNANLHLLGVQDRGKRQDWFYLHVLSARRECEKLGLPYAETIAKYNDVEPGTVYRWINEAKRRGLELLDEAGEEAAAQEEIERGLEQERQRRRAARETEGGEQ